MESDQKTLIADACRKVLRPLVSMLLKCGMTWKEFADLSKSVFVQSASEEYGIKGRPTNVSRVSILTGIDRKEVKRQRELLAAEASPVRGKTTDATKVLSGWFQDPEFLDESGEPRLLVEAGSNPSFETLCDRYAGDIATPTMLKELLKTRAVARQPDGTLKVLSRYYQPAVRDDENLLFAVDRIRDVIDTMNNNVFPGDTGVPRFGGYADNEALPLSVVPEFREYLDKRGQAFLEEIDDWLAEHAASGKPGETETARVGISLFATERKNPKE